MRSSRLLALVTGAVLAGTLSTAALASSPVVSPKSASTTIVGAVLAADGEFDVLQAAVVKAGFVDLLNGTDQYTVFAPTDAAFVALFSALTSGAVTTESGAIAAIQAGAVDAILADVLKYHVTEGRRFSNSVLPRRTGGTKWVETALGQSLKVAHNGTITTTSGGSAHIVAPNVNATNGVIHVIDAVLVPDLD
jgi:uncharacterized surface protein with fasciclin (FAS1) repeats